MLRKAGWCSEGQSYEQASFWNIVRFKTTTTCRLEKLMALHLGVQTQPTRKTQYVDRPEMTETFADSIRTTTFDGQTLRLEFCVTRAGEQKAPGPQVAFQYPVCRLVMAPDTVVD